MYAETEYDDQLEEAPRRPRRGLFPIVGMTVLFIGVGGAMWYAYEAGVEAGSDSGVPLIAAANAPVKVRPADPGGLEVPHQNVLVYERLGTTQTGTVPEHLLARPEEPIARSSIPMAPAPEAMFPKIQIAPTATDPTAPNPTGSMIEMPSRGLETLPRDPLATTVQPDATTPETQPQPESPKATGPVEAAPATPAAPPSPPPAAPSPALADGYRVQLASLRSETDARGAWDRLQRSYPGLLGKLQPQVRRVDIGAGKGTFYRLQAGPLSEKIIAEMLCGELKQRKVDCLIVQP